MLQISVYSKDTTNKKMDVKNMLLFLTSIFYGNKAINKPDRFFFLSTGLFMNFLQLHCLHLRFHGLWGTSLMFSLDRTSCHYSVVCSASSIPMECTSFILFSWDQTSHLIGVYLFLLFFSFGMFLCHWTVPLFLFYYGALSFIVIIFFFLVSSM